MYSSLSGSWIQCQPNSHTGSKRNETRIRGCGRLGAPLLLLLLLLLLLAVSRVAAAAAVPAPLHIVIPPAFLAPGQPALTVWQHLQQQRLGRLTRLLKGDMPQAPSLNSAWSLLLSLIPKAADSAFAATLDWYSSTQRPMFAASDLQHFMQAVRHSSTTGDLDLDKDLSDLNVGLVLGAADMHSNAPLGLQEGERFWSHILEHVSGVSVHISDNVDHRGTHDVTKTSSMGPALLSKQFKSVIIDRVLEPLTTASDSGDSSEKTGGLLAAVTPAAAIPQPSRRLKAAAAAAQSEKSADEDPSSSRSSSGTKTVRAVTRAVPTGYVTSVTESFSGIDIDSSSSSDGSSSSPRVTAADGSVQWPDLTSSAGTQQGQQIPPYRIIGGQEAPLNRYKWACSLRGVNDFHFCGCSLIAPSVVLTAAHCLNHPGNDALSLPWVEVGRHYLNGSNRTEGNNYDRLKCVKNVIHDGWSFQTGLNDIALCFLDGRSRFSPVQLAAADNKLAVGRELTVMGWGAQSEGATNAPQLMEVNVNVVSIDTCNAAYQNAIWDTQVCAGVPQGGQDACQGDSGGPLIIEGKTAATDVQVGIVSYGVGCGRPNTPGVYTDISKYRTFIRDQLLANGVAYPPLTGTATAAPASAPAPTAAAPVAAAARPAAAATPTTTRPRDSCACSVDGYSGRTNVGLVGCKQHGLDLGDVSYYCYVQGGRSCTKATASTAYPGAAWLDCEPPTSQTRDPPAVAATDDGQTANPTPTNSSSSIDSSSSSDNSKEPASFAALALQALQGWMYNAASPVKTNGTAVVRSLSVP